MFNRCGKRDMCLSPWPNWVYNQCDSRALASRLNEKVQVLCKLKLFIQFLFSFMWSTYEKYF